MLLFYQSTINSLTMEKVDVVISNYSQTKKLCDCLLALHAYCPNVGQVIVCNDFGPEKTRDYLRSEIDGHLALCSISDKNEGFAANVNRGLRMTTSRIVLSLNDDTYCDRDFLSPAVESLQNDSVGIVGALTLYPSGLVEHAGITHNTNDPLYFDNLFRISKPDTQAILTARSTFAVTGACMFIRAELFDKIGYFDEKFRLGFDDVDYCLSAKLAGYDVVYDPAVRLYHYGGSTRGTKAASSAELESMRHFWEKRYHTLCEQGGILEATVPIPTTWDLKKE